MLSREEGLSYTDHRVRAHSAGGLAGFCHVRGPELPWWSGEEGVFMGQDPTWF